MTKVTPADLPRAKFEISIAVPGDVTMQSQGVQAIAEHTRIA